MFKNFLGKFVNSKVTGEARLSSVVRETDETISIGDKSFYGNYRSGVRDGRSRQSVLEEIDAISNIDPLAKRIIEITTDYVVGTGWLPYNENGRISKLINQFWNNTQNDINTQLPIWADELWRTGDLFLIVTKVINQDFVRIVPSSFVKEINTAENDVLDEISFTLYDDRQIVSYKKKDRSAANSYYMLHASLNKRPGENFGHGDLECVLYWLKMYRNFLEDRVRINHYKQVFTYILKKDFNNQAEKDNYVRTFALNLPKKAGGILALDASDSFDIAAAKLESNNAEIDALMIKKLIAAGVGLPLHFLADPESSTRTTANEAGEPTLKRFRSRQNILKNLMILLLKNVIEDSDLVLKTADVERFAQHFKTNMIVPDISSRDNLQLANSAKIIFDLTDPMRVDGLITADEQKRLIYKFMGETRPE